MISCADPGDGAPAPGPAATGASALEEGQHRFCGWLYASASDPAGAELAYDTFAAHAAELDAVHPAWWRVESPTSIVNHPRSRQTPYPGFHDARVLSHTTPGGARTRLVPMIAASSRPDFVHVHHMINDPELRAQHVRAVVAIAVDHGYDGVDLDYEHLDPANLGSDLGPGQTWITERKAFSTFITEVAQALHAAGKTLSLAVPAVTSSEEVFDYEALSAAADQVHIMGYDFHFEGGTHAGPLAPISWIEEAAAYAGSIDGGRRRAKFLLGLPNYGILGPETPRPGGEVTGCASSRACADLVGGAYAVTTDHLAHCPLAGPGSAVPGRAPNAVLPSGDHLFFEDLGSLEERVVAAERAGLGGITYWSMGGEPEQPGSPTFFQMVRSHFPR
jgi:spore germination protein YaaH